MARAPSLRFFLSQGWESTNLNVIAIPCSLIFKEFIVKLVIASDHAGFALKEEIRASLAQAGHEVVDLGAYNTESSDYPDFAEKVGLALKQGVAARGILLCGSGVGACIAANKIPGIRAGICHDTYSAHQGVEHDDMNVLVLGARIIGASAALESVYAYIGARFITTEERYTRRFKKVQAIEAKYQCGDGSASPA
jgi:ribose 5-phosphate isomerase B